jgi:hypothetical protein
VSSALSGHSSGVELLDAAGQETLRSVLRLELPELSRDGIAGLATEIATTAHMLAAVEWRRAGYRPPDAPTVGRPNLAAAIVVHLHGSPHSPAAGFLVRRWRAHLSLHAPHGLLRRPRPSDEALRAWTKLIHDQEEAVYSYWQELEGTA